jgi:phenylpyruvate tautomerase PptA (4-oxalocrotonate tautomerase family)
MPIMCQINLPKGKKQDKIEKTLGDVAKVLMENFEAQPNQVRVTIDELPKVRYMAGGVLAKDMPDFQEDEETE